SKEILFTNGLIKIPDLLNKYKISRRWMEKGFAERVGVSPKYYLDLIRFNHVIRLLRNSPKQDWGQIIFDCGFYDHPHLIRQFKKFTNASPKLLMEQENELIEYLLGKY
ncbi:MAG: helix-turn-helix domain-containing protein, partial [Cyclobacteriaceae bacterium]